MIKITLSRYEPKSKLAIHFGKTVRHINYAEAKTIISTLSKFLTRRRYEKI